MKLNIKRIAVIALGSALLLIPLAFERVAAARDGEKAGVVPAQIQVPEGSKPCIACHGRSNPGIVDHWKGSAHAQKGVGCVECHKADAKDADAFKHYGATIAAVVTPRDCSGCHQTESAEFSRSHHAKAGQILASLDNFLAETVEGARMPFNPHSPTPGKTVDKVNGLASVAVGCKQCHGAKVGLSGPDGTMITVDDLKPGPDGKPTNLDVLDKVVKDSNGRPQFHPDTWPNTGIGRLNLDGSVGSCSACHSRHDFSRRRARQPENCGKCHLGPDHPQKEIYEESKHGVAYRDLREHMNLDSKTWVLGKDYSQAPTCATCHMSGNLKNGGRVTHDPGERISWTNRPPISLALATDTSHKVVTETDPDRRAALIADTWQAKRGRMQQVCSTCHTSAYVDNFYKQYDDFVVLFNEKFAKPGQKIVKALTDQGLITKDQFDEEIEWTWYYLWHHEGRRARHGASMMAPDYAHWHGMFEVADRFYQELIPQAREITAHAAQSGKTKEAAAVNAVIDGILARPEHAWKNWDSPKK